jgi:hypothetical protein
METIARAINDEDIFETWLIYGVADGDIDETTTDEELDYYVGDDEVFADLMHTFTLTMKRAHHNGGLYVDGVVSENMQ